MININVIQPINATLMPKLSKPTVLFLSMKNQFHFLSLLHKLRGLIKFQLDIWIRMVTQKMRLWKDLELVRSSTLGISQ